MVTIYETRYYGPTDNNGSRIRVKNLRTGESKTWHWDYAINSGHDQHKHAVTQCAIGEVVSVEYGGESRQSYYWTVTR
jgi:hypothetical protein